MKFLTRDVYDSWYRGDFEDDARIRAAVDSYTAYVEALGAALPDSLHALARLAGVDDGLVAELRYAPKRRILVLTLRCGDRIMGYYDLRLEYRHAAICVKDRTTLARITRTTLSDRRHDSDLCFHEVDRAEDDRFEHRLLFHPGVWFAVRFEELLWEKVERRDRRLPGLRGRRSASRRLSRQDTLDGRQRSARGRMTPRRSGGP